MEDALVRLVVVVALVAGAALAGAWWRGRDGHVRAADPAAPRLDPDELAALGFSAADGRTAALLLTSPTCASCVTARRLLDELALVRRDLEWTDVDVTGRPDLASRFGIMRLPTVLLVDPVDGHLVARAAGVPVRGELEALLDRRAATPR